MQGLGVGCAGGPAKCECAPCKWPASQPTPALTRLVVHGLAAGGLVAGAGAEAAQELAAGGLNAGQPPGGAVHTVAARGLAVHAVAADGLAVHAVAAGCSAQEGRRGRLVGEPTPGSWRRAGPPMNPQADTSRLC